MAIREYLATFKLTYRFQAESRKEAEALAKDLAKAELGPEAAERLRLEGVVAHERSNESERELSLWPRG